ncbi:MAG TPA: alpha/beta hydrolase, partial [Nitrososphaeraceae archaeon]
MPVPLFIVFVFILIIIPSNAILISNNNYFGTTSNFAYGHQQSNQMNPNNIANSLEIQSIPSKQVHVGDIDIAYKTFGKGDAILLISGSGNVMDVWPSSMLQELSSNHTVIIFDNRGVGNTTSGTRPFSIQQFANDTVGLLDALKIQKADVLGFSMASFIAQELTLMHPEKVNRLILYGASCGGQESIPQSPEVVRALSDFVNNRTRDVETFLSVTFPSEWIKAHPNYLETIPKSAEIVPSTTLVKQFNAVENWLDTNWSGVCSQLSNISKPTLIITGTEDVAVPAANSIILAQKIPGAWLVQIKDAGHGLMYQYPDKFNKVLQTFLSTTTTIPS